MRLNGSTALVTGSNRGIGHAFATELVRRGAKVYATARRPELVDVPGAEVLRLDTADQASVEAAAEAAADVDLLVNNAASTAGGNLVDGDLRAIRDVLDSNFHGTLAVVRAFAPVLARNGGGAILNVLSVAAWATVEGNTAYAAAKSAQWGLTNGIRLELAGQGTQVTALVPGMTATEPMKAFVREFGLDLPEGAMNDPAELVRLALDGVEAGQDEVLDRYGVQAKELLSGPPRAFDLSGTVG
ncbi:SDR family NAD(P)-dependent oxidoreductase [Kineococcus rhizosphaerae]|uniref:Short-subunit dehydrogenase n=1 Tax=Kineococcus rhizosphaerae TaxID=559628 RepID=A0A2T0QY56_9ACTN|nr:SDR family NAD(P)-dependent oxidoreductase [Kineococcus rhizosphaerae]PRY11126.1 short-subunit dehydrogenase [Kineococcus rhizosphaerae]